ncbi:S1 family peptidase [Pontibacter qinzhouensis]|uniref:S1 family peptidase n=1 Tax=Pontibacter qinzhouensis TaxID=2603253 RepID=A0A5C8JDI8_9BACT|nr:S1 family peptidase [Pontibacter qinzhouensis]TXK36465.1 S1 family peptidase [Pontibacter qinzhouensis]
MLTSIPSIFKNENRNWFYIFGSIFIVLVMIYLLLHNMIQGEEIINFTKAEIANIEAIIDNTSSQLDSTGKSKRNLDIDEREVVKANIREYIVSRYSLTEEFSKTNFGLFLTQYANAGFPTSFLSEYKLKVKSYFWLTENEVFLEIIFWSLFGVLCSLFYYISEAMATGTFEPEQEYVHAAKLFYAPLTALVIYFSINALISNGEVNLNSLRHGLIILSYILGFFSGRTIELLSRLKDLLLPTGNREKETGRTASGKIFEQLTEDEQHTLILKAIEANDEKWRSKYPNIQAIGSGKKYIDEKKTNLNAIIFTVTNKEDDLNSLDKVPEYVAYDGYQIATDVQEVPALITSQSIRALGSGVSRIDSDKFGTIGLKVYRSEGDHKKFFILSCYHVLCRTELLKQELTVSDPHSVNAPEVVCPCKKDDASVMDNIVGKVEFGKLNSYLDAAIAKLPYGSMIENKIGSITNPSAIYDLKKDDEDNNFYVQTWGWTSKYSTGKVKKIYDNPNIIYEAIGPKVLKELIQVEKISANGDSGAPVFTMAGEVVGIIVGGDNNKISYVLPIRTIINGLNIKL